MADHSSPTSGRYLSRWLGLYRYYRQDYFWRKAGRIACARIARVQADFGGYVHPAWQPPAQGPRATRGER